ncbi:hypothetical protein KSS87_010456 [Heliosperma pusillum]|nr:hypothetical protein KSS87_010456 [Heliosperma pusillum]
MGEFQKKGVEVAEKIYVAVSKEVDESMSVFTWALQNSGGKIVCLIHVHQPAKKRSIPEKEVKSFREQGREEMFTVLDEYLRISQRFGVCVETFYIEADSIEKGIIQLIEQHNIEKLVIGAAADQHYYRKMVEVRSQKAIYVRDNAPPFCHIWFICSGNLIHTRKAMNSSAAYKLPPSRWSTDSIESSCSSLGSTPVGRVSQSSSMFMTENESESSINDHPYDRLERDLMEAEKTRQAAFKESMRRRKAEKDALSDAMFKAKTADRLYNEEIRLRKATEEELAKEYKFIKDMESLQLKVSLELRKTDADKLSLEKLFEKSNACRKESEEKLLSLEEMLKKYNYEREKLEMERDNALKEAENLREQLGHTGAGPSSSNSLVDVPVKLSDFSCSDLLKATMDFNESLKIGEGSYGSIYKGYLRDTEVTIKILNHRSLTNSPRQFDQEVDVLSKLQHPNLVRLIGTCPEICGLVYEYLPGGSLEDRLSCKDNDPPLPWETRIQIAIDLCSVLIFLHLSRPSYVHGNLKPSNVLLDANCVWKLSNLGIRDIDYIDPKGALVYMDPKVCETGEFTPKSDVYSLGIILLRLLTGKSALGILVGKSGLSEGSIYSKLDSSAGEWPLVQAEQLARMALRCCDMDQKKRPDLSDIWSVLESMKASRQSLSIPQLASNHQPPNYFMCPIFQEIMEDPRIASDGFTYEAEAIRGWLDGGHDNSPMTNVTLANHNLTPNRALRSAIQEWRLHNRSA